MSGWAQQHLPCEKCGSSDAKSLSTTGWYKCFACNRNWKSDNVEEPSADTKAKGSNLVQGGECEAIPGRRISQATAERFGYRTTTDGRRGPEEVAPYCDPTGRVKFQKIRGKDKQFRIAGTAEPLLFGQHLFRPSDKLRIVVTEGELDALSVFEACGNWPVVSVPNGAQGARQAIAAQREYLAGFKEVVLCFDNDEPGQKAMVECAGILPPGKTFICHLPLKDASEMLTAGRKKDLHSALWSATPYRPDKIVAAADLWEEVSKPQEPCFVEYPWEGLNEYLGGLRRGEIVTWMAASGIGKSTVTREIAYELGRLGKRVGVIALEETVRETIRYQMGIHTDRQLHMSDCGLSSEELKDAFDAVSPNLFTYNDSAGMDLKRVGEVIRYLAVADECEVVVLDHISIIVSGSVSTNERQDIDNLMTELRRVAQDTGVNIQLVSHIKRLPEDRKELRLTDLRGSSGIEGISNQVVGVEQYSDDGPKALRSRIRVLKNRFKGWKKGICQELEYHPNSGRLLAFSGQITDKGDDDDDF